MSAAYSLDLRERVVAAVDGRDEQDGSVSHVSHRAPQLLMIGYCCASNRDILFPKRMKGAARFPRSATWKRSRASPCVTKDAH